MPTISTGISRSATRSMWLAEWRESPSIPPWASPFLPFLSRFLGHGGRLSWTSRKVVQEQWGHENGRRYTSRWIEKLLAALRRAGAIERVIHSAPGQPAVYRAIIPGHPGYRPLTIRRRGIRPRRLLASFRKEKGHDCVTTGFNWDKAKRQRVLGRRIKEQPTALPTSLPPTAVQGRPSTTAKRPGTCLCGAEIYEGDMLVRGPVAWTHTWCEVAA